MLFLAGGVAILCGLLLLVWLFVNADPARLVRGAKWTGLVVVALVCIALLIVTEGRVAIFLAPLVPLWPLWRRLRSAFQGARGPATGRNSTAETATVRMRLDHDTGAMTGTVLRGRFAGMRIEELGRGDLLDLLRQCRADDEEAARLVEAYLDRAHPDWRDDLRGGEHAGAASRGADMTIDEAYAILGLAPGADADAIRAAHRRLMMQLHPDHGGSDYLATQINRARDLLLRRR
ncbi:MAG TPA: DnaJ domain-containing protein [Stellaceae bacterium]|nr:DnaJ domain-containing protein [Stellaceae bacterium]